MSYSPNSIYYDRPYPQCALESQLRLVSFIERTLLIRFHGKTLDEMSKFIDANIDAARSADVDNNADLYDEF